MDDQENKVETTKSRKPHPVSVIQILDADGAVLQDNLADDTLKAAVETLGEGQYTLRRYTDRKFEIIKKESKSVKGL